MKQKTIILITIAIFISIILLLFTLVIFYNNKCIETYEYILEEPKTEITIPSNINEEQDLEENFENSEPLEWHGKYIWDETKINNSWVCFRKKITLQKDDLKNIIAQLSVDSKYWLYINSQMVIREGQLKRGEEKESIYYDEINLTKYLQEGENTVAILVWYWGGESLSHVSSEQPAMLFQMKVGNNYIVSDDTWKVSKNPAYLQDELMPNYRLAEYNIWYNANLSLGKWYRNSYDDSKWQNATIIGNAGDLPWGNLIKRDIPQFKDFGLKEYKNIEKYKNYTTTTTEKLELKIPYNAQFTPYLEIEAPKGLKIQITTDMYSDKNGPSVMCTYITKERKTKI